MGELEDLLKRQAEWQRSLRHLSWAEKMRWVERMREGILLLRRSRPPRDVRT